MFVSLGFKLIRLTTRNPPLSGEIKLTELSAILSSFTVQSDGYLIVKPRSVLV
jgi:hypothetical protein